MYIPFIGRKIWAGIGATPTEINFQDRRGFAPPTPETFEKVSSKL
jgi:hypothetical protein